MICLPQVFTDTYLYYTRINSGNGASLIMKKQACNTLVIGAGIIGISTAYYLKKHQPDLNVILIDSGQPMSLTSAQSGENYRNWWPHPVMTAFTDHSIDLMEAIAEESGNRINMNRRGYTLVTRSDDPDQLMNELVVGYGQAAKDLIRVHETASSNYQAPISKEWQTAPTGVDVLRNQDLIRQTFPSYDPEIKTLIHIRRAGDISGQQMGQHMLDYFKSVGGVRVTGEVVSIDKTDGFQVFLNNSEVSIQADHIVNAAGPFINDIAEMLGTSLPVRNTLQQKIAFEDTAGVIPRVMPFSIDLDDQLIDWNDEERELLAADEDYAWLTENMQGAIHCRPDGGDHGRWVKLGWAYNDTSETSLTRTPQLYENFPEIVLRGAARLNAGLKTYYEKLPSKMHHYGGYYTLTDENWPLIGKMDVEGAYVVGAMSGFGTMAACASGDLCARTLLGRELPEFAGCLSLQRYNDLPLMEELMSMSSRGVL